MAVTEATDLKAVLAVASAEAMVADTVVDTVDMENKCVRMQNGLHFWHAKFVIIHHLQNGPKIRISK
jgi:hypothetical protein